MLTKDEVERLKKAITATVATPVVGSIEDYSWEAIFHYVKDIGLSDPALGRSKLLYDAVDKETATGWSLKSLQLENLEVTRPFSFVIQRADIFKKAELLGFSELTENSPPSDLGEAIIQHWNQKINSSRLEQGIINSYESVLLKTKKGDQYAYCEFPLDSLNSKLFSWEWTVKRKTGSQGFGLQGIVAGKVELTWYKNQKQLFRTRCIPLETVFISVERSRLKIEDYIRAILSILPI